MQEKNSSYVCELCLKNGKYVESTLAIEDDNSQDSKPCESETVSTSKQMKHSSQLPPVNGKVCSHHKYQVLTYTVVIPVSAMHILFKDPFFLFLFSYLEVFNSGQYIFLQVLRFQGS